MAAAAGGGGGGGGRGGPGVPGGPRGGPRRLRPWLVAQLESGAFPGLVWDDAERRALRIPWRHGGRDGARGGAGAALCRAWAEYKGRVRAGARPDPAGWKTRLRCALHKSPEFQELPERARHDGPNPYKVYRLRVAVESARLLPQAEDPSSLCLRLWVGGCLSWQGWLPPGDYLLLSPPPGTPARDPPLLPRLLLLPPEEEDEEGEEDEGGGKKKTPPQMLLGGLRQGLLVASAARGLFLRRRQRRWGDGEGAGGLGGGPGGDGGGVGVHCRAPHLPPRDGTPLPEGELLLVFDPQRFRQEVERHRQGLGPYPEHRVTLAVGGGELGPHDGPHNRRLVLQLEQAMAQQLLDTLGHPPCGTQA